MPAPSFRRRPHLRRSEPSTGRRVDVARQGTGSLSAQAWYHCRHGLANYQGPNFPEGRETDLTEVYTDEEIQNEISGADEGTGVPESETPVNGTIDPVIANG